MPSALTSGACGVIGAVYSGVGYEAGGVPMLDTIDEGLSDSQLLKAIDRDGGILSKGTEGKCRDTEVALE